MSYQARQPCTAPPIYQETSASPYIPQCSDPSPCSEGASASSYQYTQPSVPPPCCPQSSPTEILDASTSPCVSFHTVIDGETLTEVSSPTPCESATTQPQPTLPQPSPVEIRETPISPCVAVYATEPLEGPEAPREEPTRNYVMPGSIVILDPSGTITVKPGPDDEEECSGARESVFVAPYTPHFS
ncbi:cornifin alpha [Anolis carolinensis]|uniref:cornifin alpha n=1 Tax=Anolis carolinensis TaxID=28377 RepID=UPI000203A6F6|nr:PREDICTED: cornifin alpha-like [Anolis carolinensis]|eukprot:XP_016852277.1 PREDICTED: cornifin alpha-like [Anolis carolinensis]